MKFALTHSVPAEDSASLLARCKSLGYHGVELPSDIISDTDQLKIFTDAAIQIACVDLPVQFTGDATADAKAATQIRTGLTAAQHAGCHLLKIPDAKPRRRESITATITAMADWLAPLADAAADSGMTLLISTGPIFSTARPLWMLMERLDHAAVGVSWNVEQTRTAGESPAVTVPTLNTRIRYVQMSDANVPESIPRLQGIGYTGWIAFPADKSPELPTLGLPAK